MYSDFIIHCLIGEAIHSMRDNPAHNTPLLGASWGARMDQSEPTIRENWKKSWNQILEDELTYDDRGQKGPDQDILTQYVRI